MDEKSHEKSQELNEELAGVLQAISIVSKRLALKLAALSRQQEFEEKGGNQDERNEN